MAGDIAPLQVLLADQQVHFEGPVTALYRGNAIRIASAEGLAMMRNVAVQWKPASDRLILHSLNIVRGAQVIDLLAAGRRFAVPPAATSDTDRAAGRVTVVYPLAGLAIGDIVSFAYTVERREPLLGQHHEAVLEAGSAASVARLALAASWAPGDAMMTRAGHMPRPLVVGATGASMDPGPAPGFALPADAPDRFRRGRFVEFSDYAGWGEVAALFVPLFDAARRPASGSAILSEIARIASAGPDPLARAGAALALVEQRIAYVPVDSGDADLRPTSADAAWARGQGDCKAKAAVLLALLDGLGIAAEPALVNARHGDGLDARLPGVMAFDHAIVRAVIDGKVFWLDPTRTGDRSLAGLETPAFHWALPIHAGADKLEALAVAPATEPGAVYTLRLDASGGLGVPASAKAEAVFHGDAARALHTSIAAVPQTLVTGALTAYWARQYGFVAPAAVGETWDDGAGMETLTMAGTARLDWRASADSGDAAPGETALELAAARLGWAEAPPRAAGPESDAPIAIDYPDYTEFRETVVLPGDGGDFRVEGEDVDRIIAGRAVYRHTARTGNVVTTLARVRPIAPEVPLAEALAGEAELRRLRGVPVRIAGASSGGNAGEMAVEAALRPRVSTDAPRAIELLRRPEERASTASGGGLPGASR